MGHGKSPRERKLFFSTVACCVGMACGLVGCIPTGFQQQEYDGQGPSKLQFKVSQDEYEASTLVTLKEAESKMGRGEYEASVHETLRVLEQDSMLHKDRALFLLGILYAHPLNPDMDYVTSANYFGRILIDFPLSEKREEARIWILTIHSKEECQEIRRNLAKELEKAVEEKEKKVKDLREAIEQRDRRLSEMGKELSETKNRVTELEDQMSRLKDVDLSIEKKKLSPSSAPSP